MIQQMLTQKCLGWVLISDSFSDCLILDWCYVTPSCIDTLYEEHDDGQIVVSEELESEDQHVGVYVPIDLMTTDEGAGYAEIPVYAEYVGEQLHRIYVDIEQWVEVREGQEPQRKVLLPSEQQAQRSRQLIGYLTATGGGFLIADTEFALLCRDFFNNEDSQIIVQPDTEDVSPFYAGVFVNIPSDSQDKKFSVYGENEQDVLKRIAIDLLSVDDVFKK
jgi:hypothetical protein